MTTDRDEAMAITKVKAMFEHEYCVHCGVEVPAPGSCEDCEAFWSDPSPLYVNEDAARTHSVFSHAFQEAERELGEAIGYPALVYQQEEDGSDIKTDLDGTVDELRRQLAEAQARITQLTMAAEAAYTQIDEWLDPGEWDDPPPRDLLEAHALLYVALDKAPSPDPVEDKSYLPF